MAVTDNLINLQELRAVHQLLLNLKPSDDRTYKTLFMVVGPAIAAFLIGYDHTIPAEARVNLMTYELSEALKNVMKRHPQLYQQIQNQINHPDTSID